MFTVYANGSNPLGGYGIGEIIENGFASAEEAAEYVIDGWGEPALQQVSIREDLSDDEGWCRNCNEVLPMDAVTCPHCRAHDSNGIAAR